MTENWWKKIIHRYTMLNEQMTSQ